MRVIDLVPGTIIENGTYICQVPHPVYKSLQLVVWIMKDGNVMLDALSPGQFVGVPLPSTDAQRQERLLQAFARWRRDDGMSALTLPIFQGRTNV